FLLEETLCDEDVRTGLREDLQAGRFIPVVCCSADKEIGLSGLIHFLIAECPAPDQRKGFRTYKDPKDTNSEEVLAPIDPNGPFSAYVFKTVNDDYAGRLSFIKVISGSISGDCQVLNVNKGD